jgi:hypothetical protein
MRGRAGAGGAIGDGAGTRLCERDQLSHGLRSKRGMCDEPDRHLGETADGHKILLAVERPLVLLVKVMLGREHPELARDQRVAVGSRLSDRDGGDGISGTGPVLHHDRLLPLLRQPLGHHARQYVGGGTGCAGRDDRDGARRIGLRGSGCAREQANQHRERRKTDPHGHSLLFTRAASVEPKRRLFTLFDGHLVQPCFQAGGSFASIRMKAMRHGLVPLLTHAWLVPCWTRTSPAFTCTSVSSISMSISPSSTRA